MIVMAKSLGLKTVAEGIETQAQLDHLVEAECDSVQGFLLAKPMPASEIEKLPGNLLVRMAAHKSRSRVHH